MIRVHGGAVMIKGTTTEILAEATGVLVGVYRNLRKAYPDELADEMFARIGRVAVEQANNEDAVIELINVVTKGE